MLTHECKHIEHECQPTMKTEYAHAGRRLDYIRTLLGFNVLDFCRRIDISRTTYYQWIDKEDTTDTMVVKLTTKIPEVNSKFIRTGEGEIFSEQALSIAQSYPDSALARVMSKPIAEAELAKEKLLPYDVLPAEFKLPENGGVDLQVVSFDMDNNSLLPISGETFTIDISLLDTVKNATAVVLMNDNSMVSPRGFAVGQPLVVETMNTKQPERDGIYALRIEKSFHVRQLQNLPKGRIKVKPFNQSFDSFELLPENDFQIVGRVKFAHLAF